MNNIESFFALLCKIGIAILYVYLFYIFICNVRTIILARKYDGITLATITGYDISTYREKALKTYRYNPIYEYKVNGREFKLSGHTYIKKYSYTPMPVGQQVRLTYDEKDPSKFMTKDELYRLCCQLVFLAVALLVYSYVLKLLILDAFAGMI